MACDNLAQSGPALPRLAGDGAPRRPFHDVRIAPAADSRLTMWVAAHMAYVSSGSHVDFDLPGSTMQ